MRARLSHDLLAPLLEQAAVGIAVLDAEGRYVYVNDWLAKLNRVPAEDHLGRHLAEVIPHMAETVGALHRQVLRTGEPAHYVQHRGSTPGAPEAAWQASYMPMVVAGAPAVGVVLTDVSERELALVSAHERVRQHAAVADLGHRALAGATIEELLGEATRIVLRELDADRAGVLRIEEGGERMVMCAGAGWPEGAIGVVTADMGRRSQAGFTLMHGGPVLTRDIETETRFDISPGMRGQGTRSTISTPIRTADGMFGVLGVFSQTPDRFDADDAGFMDAVANVLGAAIVRDEQTRALARVGEQRGRLVAQALDEGERLQRHVADMLHDEVLQDLLFARQELTDPTAGPEGVARARASIEEAVAQLRRLVAGLHPITLAHAGLSAALERLAEEQRTRTGLATTIAVAPDADGRHDRLILSIVRELLINVSKHARARRAHVSVAARDGRIALAVADDGRGMPPDAFESALAGGHIGLARVRERAEAIGGEVRIAEGLDGRGVAVEVHLPLEAAPAAPVS